MSNRIGVLDANGNYVRLSNNVSQNLKALDTQAKVNANAISDEARIRANADTALSNRIGELTEDGYYVSTSNNVSENLKALDDKLGESVNGMYVKTVNTVNENLTVLDSQVKANEDSIRDLDTNKANRDASNVVNYAQEWADAIGTGKVTATNTKLVTGKTVYDALTDGNMEINVKAVTARTIQGTNVTVNNKLNVSGDSNLYNTYIDGVLDVTDDANFHGNTKIDKDLFVEGNTTVKKNLRVNEFSG